MIIKIVSLLVYFVGAFVLVYFKKFEGRDERGKTILNKALGMSFSILVLGIICLIAYDKYYLIPHDNFILYLYSLLSTAFAFNACYILILRKKN